MNQSAVMLWPRKQEHNICRYRHFSATTVFLTRGKVASSAPPLLVFRNKK